MSENHDTKRKPVDYDELFPGRFLKAGLFKGKPHLFTITDVDVEDLPQDNGKSRARGVISFAETKMQLVLNSTNGQCLRSLFGRKVADWVGKKIWLAPESDQFGRETVEAVRVYGSPSLHGDLEIEITLPRKRPKRRTLHAKLGQRDAPEREPGID